MMHHDKEADKGQRGLEEWAFGDKSGLTEMLADPCELPWTSENERPRCRPTSPSQPVGVLPVPPV